MALDLDRQLYETAVRQALESGRKSMSFAVKQLLYLLMIFVH